MEGPLIDFDRRPSEAEQFHENLLKRAHLSEAFLLAQNNDAATRLQQLGNRLMNENENSGYILGHQRGMHADLQNSKGEFVVHEEDEMLAELDEDGLLASLHESREQLLFLQAQHRLHQEAIIDNEISMLGDPELTK